MHTVAIVNKNILSVIEKVKPGKVYKVYVNFYNDRKELYKEFKGDKKSFIYVIVNKLNGKCYVGSTRSIKNRIVNYFNLAHIAAQKGRPISSARALPTFLTYICLYILKTILIKLSIFLLKEK
jgi:hypothetical protein